jgi:drug/metabolite transporter (DMT)-like permease
VANELKNGKKVKIWAALLAVYIVWGSTYLAIYFAVQTMPPFLMAAVRFLVAGSILFLWRKAVNDSPATRSQWRSAAIVGLFLLLGGNGGVVWAEQRVASGVTALLIGATPLWMVLMDAWLPNGRKPTFQTWLGVLLGFGGIVLLIGPGDFAGATQGVDLLGVGALMIATLCWAAGSIYSRNADLPASPLLGTSMEMLVGGAGLLLLGTFTGEWSRLEVTSISPESWLGLGYLIFFGSLVGFASYTWLLRVAPTPLVSTYAYVNPLVAIFLGYWLANEPLTPRTLLAAGIIVASVAIINTSRKAPTRMVDSQPAPVSGGDD